MAAIAQPAAASQAGLSSLPAPVRDILEKNKGFLSRIQTYESAMSKLDGVAKHFKFLGKALGPLNTARAKFGTVWNALKKNNPELAAFDQAMTATAGLRRSMDKIVKNGKDLMNGYYAARSAQEKFSRGDYYGALNDAYIACAELSGPLDTIHSGLTKTDRAITALHGGLAAAQGAFGKCSKPAQPVCGGIASLFGDVRKPADAAYKDIQTAYANFDADKRTMDQLCELFKQYNLFGPFMMMGM